eukprot:Hpha_TRINITY_DN9201_c0_g1::TRINITY_DN9201_c0_g1_i1::g.28730::m.28730
MKAQHRRWGGAEGGKGSFRRSELMARGPPPLIPLNREGALRELPVNVGSSDKPKPTQAWRTPRAVAPAAESPSQGVGDWSDDDGRVRRREHWSDDDGQVTDMVRRREQRQRQIDLGKSTEGYQTLCRVRDWMGEYICATPTLLYAPKRRWDLELRTWRRTLHLFDCVEFDTATGEPSNVPGPADFDSVRGDCNSMKKKRDHRRIGSRRMGIDEMADARMDDPPPPPPSVRRVEDPPALPSLQVQPSPEPLSESPEPATAPRDQSPRHAADARLVTTETERSPDADDGYPQLPPEDTSEQTPRPDPLELHGKAHHSSCCGLVEHCDARLLGPQFINWTTRKETIKMRPPPLGLVAMCPPAVDAWGRSIFPPYQSYAPPRQMSHPPPLGPDVGSFQTPKSNDFHTPPANERTRGTAAEAAGTAQSHDPTETTPLVQPVTPVVRDLSRELQEDANGSFRSQKQSDGPTPLSRPDCAGYCRQGTAAGSSWADEEREMDFGVPPEEFCGTEQVERA